MYLKQNGIELSRKIDSAQQKPQFSTKFPISISFSEKEFIFPMEYIR